ncbi:MAG: PD-(D/E)XK nuclease family protein [Solirubrobacteraceae bacterium]
MSAFTIDPPAQLPIDHLSLSSIKKFMTCPMKWKRHYLDHDPEPSSGKMILGSAGHAALAQHYGDRIEGGPGFTAEQLLDEFAAEWEDRIAREDVSFGADTPGALKDSGAASLRVYHARIAPTVKPVAVEREFTFGWPGIVDWQITGFIDLEAGDGVLHDAFDTMVRNKTPVVDVVPTARTDRQLDALTGRIFALAREIEWRCETDCWSGAAPSDFLGCGTCRYADCPLRLGSL